MSRQTVSATHKDHMGREVEYVLVLPDESPEGYWCLIRQGYERPSGRDRAAAYSSTICSAPTFSAILSICNIPLHIQYELLDAALAIMPSLGYSREQSPLDEGETNG